MTKENLLIALEPEAASLCCRYLPMSTIKGCSSGFVPFAPGSKYLVFDAGGMCIDNYFISETVFFFSRRRRMVIVLVLFILSSVIPSVRLSVTVVHQEPLS